MKKIDRKQHKAQQQRCGERKTQTLNPLKPLVEFMTDSPQHPNQYNSTQRP